MVFLVLTVFLLVNPHIKLRSSSHPESLRVSPISFVRLWDVSTSSSESARLNLKSNELPEEVRYKRRLGQPGLQQLDLQPSSTVPGNFDDNFCCSSEMLSSDKDSWKAGQAFQKHPWRTPRLWRTYHNLTFKSKANMQPIVQMNSYRIGLTSICDARSKCIFMKVIRYCACALLLRVYTAVAKHNST